MTQQPASFLLSRRAATDLRDIYAHSQQKWGANTADRYVADLYVGMTRAAEKPDIGLLRQHRSAPFLMLAAREHFIVYDRLDIGIVVLTLLHQVQNIETLISRLSPSFLNEIKRLKGS